MLSFENEIFLLQATIVKKLCSNTKLSSVVFFSININIFYATTTKQNSAQFIIAKRRINNTNNNEMIICSVDGVQL